MNKGYNDPVYNYLTLTLKGTFSYGGLNVDDIVVDAYYDSELLIRLPNWRSQGPPSAVGIYAADESGNTRKALSVDPAVEVQFFQQLESQITNKMRAAYPGWDGYDGTDELEVPSVLDYYTE